MFENAENEGLANAGAENYQLSLFDLRDGMLSTELDDHYDKL